MPDDHLADVLRFCDEALGREEADRAPYLDAACGIDTPLRRQVDALLAEQRGSVAPFFDTPPWQRPVPALAAGRRLGPYEVTGEVGSGGMGTVYAARDTRLGRTVALKVISGAGALDPAARERFTREAQTIASLNHPHVCALYDIGREGDLDFLVMEYLEGRTLRQVLADGPMPAATVVAVARQVASGLSAAHEKGILHRDLKPDNLFLCRDGTVKILDFGLAKGPIPRHGEKTVGLSHPSLVEGTVGYMSPEQVLGRELDGRSDIFSVGVVVWEMLSGRSPFRRDSDVETLHAIVKDELPALAPDANVSPALAPILGTCLAKDPAARYQSARELALALDRASTAAVDAPSVRTAEAPAGRRRTLVFAIPVVVLLVIAGVSWKRWPFPALRTGPAASVLALPAKVLGPPDVAFLSEAVSANLTTLLASVQGLETKAPPGGGVVRAANADFVGIAKAYRAQNLILSTVTAEPPRLVLDVTLIDVGTQNARWTRQFTGTRAGYAVLLRQAADAIADSIKPGAATVVSEAWQSETTLALAEGRAYLGAYAGGGHHIEDFEKALSAYQRVPESDPAFGFAVGRQAELWAMRGFSGRPEAKLAAFEHAEALARRALEKDPRSGTAWAALAQIAFHTSPVNLERVLECALKTPNRWEPGASMVERTLASTVGGASLMVYGGSRILDRSPYEFNNGAFAAMGLTWLRRYQEAVVMADRVLQLNPIQRPAVAAKAEALIGLGRLQEARALLERRPATDDDGTWVAEYWRQVRFQLAVAEGDTAMANKLADRAAALWLGPAAQDLGGTAASTMPPALVRMGRSEEALQILEKALQSVATAEGYLWVLRHPGLRSLHGDPRFARLVDKGRSNVAITVRVLERAKANGELPAFLEPFLVEMRDLVESPEPRG